MTNKTVTDNGTQTLTNKDLSSTTNTFPAALEDIKDITPTRGDLLAYNGTNWVDVGVGTNDQILTADSTEAAGVKWADASGGDTTYPLNIYTSAATTSSSSTVFTFTHNLGLSQTDVESGRYEVYLTVRNSNGVSYQLGNNVGYSFFWGSGATTGYPSIFCKWDAGSPSSADRIHHQSNTSKIFLGPAGGNFTNMRLHIIQLY